MARINKDGSPSCAEYRLRLRGNYRDKDMPRYDLNIAIFDTIRYIVPSLSFSHHGHYHLHCRVERSVLTVINEYVMLC